MRIQSIASALVCATLGVAHADSEISLYGDVDYRGSTDGTQANTKSTFQTPSLDFFTSTTANRWTFLAETLFEAGPDNQFGVDVERVEVGYLYSDWLRVRAGRFHTAIGYYNDAYHHGRYFMVPVERPRAIEFEDQGGVIPAHSIGLHADGRFAVADDHIRYDIELANGRGPEPDPPQNVVDANRAKALNIRLRYEPGGDLDGLILGGNFYVDTIAPSSADAAVSHGRLREIILGAHAVYLEHDFHVIAEAMDVRHTDIASGVTTSTFAAFGELGHAFDNVTPYVRYEIARVPAMPDLYNPSPLPNYQAVSVGTKHATSDNIALKAEAAVLFPTGRDNVYSLIGQVAFAF